MELRVIAKLLLHSAMALALSHGCSVAEAASHAQKEKRIKIQSLFEAKTEVLSILFSEPKLTLEESDMGWEVDRTPLPITYHPKHGLYLVDPGPEANPVPTLQQFDAKGRRLLNVSLTEALDLAQPLLFKAHLLEIDEQGEIILLYSTSYYDSSGKAVVSFSIASFRAHAQLKAISSLPGFRESEQIFRSADGGLWSYLWCKIQKRNYWQAYDPQASPLSRANGLQLSVLLADGRLMVVDPDSSIRICSARGSVSRPAVNTLVAKVNLVESYAMVLGKGPFVGMLAFEYREPLKQAHRGFADDRVTILRLLHVRRSHNRDVVTVLGTADVSQSYSEYDSKDELLRYQTIRQEWYHLDADGNLYVIARRGPKNPAIVVYKLALREEVRERVRSILADEAAGKGSDEARPSR